MSTRSIAGRPMLPPTTVVRPPAFRISPARVVVVVLPFEPVMERISVFKKSAASSTSPMMGMWKVRASSISGVLGATPGLSTIRSWRRKVACPWPPASTFTPASSRAGMCFASASALRRSETVTCAPRRRRNSAAAKPDTPNPTTRTFLPLSSTRESLTEIEWALPPRFSRDSFASESQDAEDAHQNQRHAAKRGAGDGLPKQPGAKRDSNHGIDERVAGHLSRGNLPQQPDEAGERQKRAYEDQVNKSEGRTPGYVWNVMQLSGYRGGQQQECAADDHLRAGRDRARGRQRNRPRQHHAERPGHAAANQHQGRQQWLPALHLTGDEHGHSSEPERDGKQRRPTKHALPEDQHLQ